MCVSRASGSGAYGHQGTHGTQGYQDYPEYIWAFISQRAEESCGYAESEEE